MTEHSEQMILPRGIAILVWLAGALGGWWLILSLIMALIPAPGRPIAGHLLDHTGHAAGLPLLLARLIIG